MITGPRTNHIRKRTIRFGFTKPNMIPKAMIMNTTGINPGIHVMGGPVFSYVGINTTAQDREVVQQCCCNPVGVAFPRAEFLRRPTFIKVPTLAGLNADPRQSHQLRTPALRNDRSCDGRLCRTKRPSHVLMVP